MTLWRMSELDVFFLSYDESVADRHFAQLQSVSPRAPRRIHGIKGLHKVYARAAEASLTERFITVDADSFVENDLVFHTTVNDQGRDTVVFAFPARNEVNGLLYGNGSIKCWRKHSLADLRTHEFAAEGIAQVDFHQVLPYQWLPQQGSINRFATDPFHAFRAGYREAVKLSLDPAAVASAAGALPTLSARTMHRLSTWVCVGMDVENGGWAILGARQGLIDYWLDRAFELASLSDFDYFAERWSRVGADHVDLCTLIAKTGPEMVRLGLPVACLTAEASIAAKAAMVISEQK